MRQKSMVDPFIPVRSKQPLLRPAAPIRIEHPKDHTQSTPSIPVVASSPAAEPKKKRKLLGPRLQLVGIIVFAAIAGLLMTIQVAGEILIGIYALAAVIFKIKSKISFTLACGMLVFVVALLFIEPSKTMAMAFATYAFLLLIIGTVMLAFESRQNNHETTGPGLKISDNED